MHFTFELIFLLGLRAGEAIQATKVPVSTRERTPSLINPLNPDSGERFTFTHTHTHTPKISSEPNYSHINVLMLHRVVAKWHVKMGTRVYAIYNPLQRKLVSDTKLEARRTFFRRFVKMDVQL